MNRTKIFSIVLLALLIPQLTLAAWWNPFSWFKKPAPVVDTQTQALENRIKELEERLEKTQIPLVTPTTTISETPKEMTTKKVPTEPKIEPKVVNAPQSVQIPPAIYSIPAQPVITSTPQPVATVPEPVLNTTEKPVDPKFEVLAVRQTIFKDKDYGYSYGGYEITIKVTAGRDNVYVPKSTTDSTNNETKYLTGFAYTIQGDEFQGLQDSKVLCGLATKNFCKTEAGQSREIVTTVWLIPDETGNYGIKFDNLTFVRGSIDGTPETHELNKIAQKLYLQ